MSVRRFVAVATTALAATGLVAAGLAADPSQARAATSVPRFDHVVLVMFENHAASQITSSSAPYFTSLASQGAKFTQSYAITHLSQPNYLALFSGSTQGVTSDSCPKNFSGANLGVQLDRDRADVQGVLGVGAVQRLHRGLQRHVRTQAQQLGRLQ